VTLRSLNITYFLFYGCAPLEDMGWSKMGMWCRPITNFGCYLNALALTSWISSRLFRLQAPVSQAWRSEETARFLY
jgi:hypothetical protein